MNSYNLYTKTPPIKLFFMVALPGAVSMIASSLWGLLDSIFVGNFLGQEAFSALNLAIPFVLINFSLADLIGVGSSVPISIALGKNQREEANNYFTCACLTIFLLGILSGGFLYAAAPWLLQIMGAEGELARLGVTYIRVYALLSPFTSIVFALDNYLRICGKINGSMGLNIAMSGAILVLEYVCIGILKLGIAGSALAVSSGMSLCAIAALIPFLRKKLTLSFCRPKPSLRVLWQFLYSGCPNFLSNTAARLTSIVMNMVLLRLGGGEAVAIYGILMNVGDLVQQLLYGTSDSLQPAIGYNWGAGCNGRVKGIIRCCLSAAAVISALGMAVMLLFPSTLVSLFLEDNNMELMSTAVYALRLYSLSNLFRWFPFCVQGFLIALNKPMPATVISVSNTFVIPLVLLVVLRPLGLDGIWLNTTVTSAIVAVMALGIFRRTWKSLQWEAE